MIQIGTVVIDLPHRLPLEVTEKLTKECNERRFSLMQKHGFNEYNEENWLLFKSWYWKMYPNRKFYE